MRHLLEQVHGRPVPVHSASPKAAPVFLRQGPYLVRFATTGADRLAACRLRFMVFNIELREGLESSFHTGYDSDEFDPVCDHLLVEHAMTGQVVGTYRLQTGTMARANLGYYSEREFDFAPYEAVRSQVIELGRACIHSQHRSSEVLELLWHGIARYAVEHGGRYLLGCCSLTSQDPREGAAVYKYLKDYQVEPAQRTDPQPAFAMRSCSPDGVPAKVPKLLRTYLAIGARICGPPAIDREFKTIDFLTLLDLAGLHPRIRSRFLGGKRPPHRRGQE
jgi:putative hemolysin